MCNQNGGVIDDMVILYLENNRFMTVFNAANRDKDLTWMQRYTQSYKVEVEDISDNVAMIAIQGPQARTILQNVSDDDVGSINRFGCGFLTISGQRCIASGTGYTGEDGLELFIPDTPIHSPQKGIQVWNTILDTGKTRGIQPCGLGARDVLRIEAGMCLYGHELTDQTTPYEARIGFVVKMDKRSDFIGSKILEKQKSEGVEKIRVGLKMRGPGIPRKGYQIIKETDEIGEITSGTFSPILKTGIGIGYVPKNDSKRGSLLQVNIRDKLLDAEIVRFPFYDMSQYGYARTA
jgi:aminomethyltransferase